jgi:hypothetical protein
MLVKELVESLFRVNPNAEIKFIIESGEELEILSIYPDNLKFLNGKAISNGEDKIIYIDLGVKND